jgi:hypothetical protein
LWLAAAYALWEAKKGVSMQWKQLQREEMASVRYNGVEQMAGRASEQMAREESKCEEREKEAWTQRNEA